MLQSRCAFLALCLAAAACSGCGTGSEAPDAGSPGADAGPPDSGLPDSGLPDAGAPDAGAPDAGSPDAGLPDAGAALESGALLGGPGPAPGYYAGVRFTSGTVTGLTDASGAFYYSAGAQVAFSVGGLAIGSVPGAPRITPFTLAGSCQATPLLTFLLVFLQSLDQDHDPTNGIQLGPLPETLAGQALASLSRMQLAQAIAQLSPGTAPVADQDSLDRFIAQVDGEEWTQRSLDTFSLLSGGERSQGAASDGQSWFFSWRLGLQRTSFDYSLENQNLAAIPLDLGLQGSDHIGDIDVFDNTLYAGIEDSKHYAHPRIALYDTHTLTLQTHYDLDATIQSEGVPWVAFDGPRQLVYSSLWDPSPGINQFDALSKMAFVRTLALSPAIGRIQGAKLYRGFLYAATDRALKVIYKINLDTGTTLPVLAMDLGVEQEGLGFLERPDGTALHTLNVTKGTTGSELRHHQRTRAPLRDLLCP